MSVREQITNQLVCCIKSLPGLNFLNIFSSVTPEISGQNVKLHCHSDGHSVVSLLFIEKQIIKITDENKK